MTQFKLAQQARRVGATSLLALALVGGAGGAVGSAITAAALTPQAAQASVAAVQTIAQTTTTTNVAGAALKAVGPSMAAQAGLQAGDVITAIGGNAVTDYASLAAQITGTQPGEQITATYARNGQQQQARVTLQAPSASSSKPTRLFMTTPGVERQTPHVKDGWRLA